MSSRAALPDRDRRRPARFPGLPAHTTPSPSRPPPPPPPPPSQPALPKAARLRVLKGVRRLDDSERELVAYLRAHFAFRGAAAFVRRYGWEVVSRAVSDYEAAPDLEEVESPAAFLVWLVRDLSDG